MEAKTRPQGKWLGKVGEIYQQHIHEVESALTGSAVSVSKNVVVSGFDVDVPDEQGTKLLREKISREAENGNLLRSKLNVAGITPIAILPEDIFNKIIAKAGFYTFYRMNSEKKVYGNGKAANDHINWSHTGVTKKEIAAVFMLSVVLGGVLFLKALQLGHFQDSVYNSLRIWAAVISLVGGLIWSLPGIGFSRLAYTIGGTVASYLAPPAILFAVPLTNYLQKRHKREDWKKEIRKVLWPKRNDTEEAGGDLFQIILPEPPAHVKKVLAKCHLGGIQTFTTVHPNAFSVVIDKKVTNELWSKYDPVICTRENGMVAVLEQFGDFPEEKEVVAYIKKHFDDFRQGLLKIDSLN